jgi:hypothetical protein
VKTSDWPKDSKPKGKAVSAFNTATHHKGVWRHGDIALRIVIVGRTWRLMVSFTLQPLYLKGSIHDVLWTGN